MKHHCRLSYNRLPIALLVLCTAMLMLVPSASLFALADEGSTSIEESVEGNATTPPQNSELNDDLSIEANTLEAPTNVVAAKTATTTIRVTWGSVEGATHYDLFRMDTSAQTLIKVARISSTVYTDAQLTTGRSYTYHVVSAATEKEAELLSLPSLESNTVALALQQPQNVTVSNVDVTKLRIAWDPVVNATQYTLYRSTAQNGTYKKVTTLTDTKYTNTGLAKGTIYYYKVQALGIDAVYHSPFSAIGAKVTRLPAVTGLTAKKTTGTEITVTWKNGVAVKGYRVFRATSLNGTYTQIATTTKKSYVDKNLARGKTYYYKVRAFHAEAKLNSVLAGPTEPIRILMGTPQGLKVSNVSPRELRLDWKAVKGAEGYRIYRSSGEGAAYEQVGTTTALTYRNKNLTPGTTYSYRIRAYKTKTSTTYDSTLSSAVSLKATFVAPALQTKWNKTYVQLSWKAVPLAEEYVIYRKLVSAKDFVELARTTKLAFNDKTGVEGKQYTYKVRAVATLDGILIQRDSKAVNRWYSRIDPSKPMIALTFDDGPSAYTRTIVDTLNAHDARATFFVMGGNMAARGGDTKYALKSGHEIGNHTQYHARLTTYTNAEIKYEMKWAGDSIEKAIGLRPTIMRPPGGFTDARVAANVGMPVIMWSVDTNDWRTQSAVATSNSVLGARDGDIVIMHDTHYSTMIAMQSTIAELKRRGVQMVTISELAKYRGYTLKSGGTYYSLR